MTMSRRDLLVALVVAGVVLATVFRGSMESAFASVIGSGIEVGGVDLQNGRTAYVTTNDPGFMVKVVGEMPKYASDIGTAGVEAGAHRVTVNVGESDIVVTAIDSTRRLFRQTFQTKTPDLVVNEVVKAMTDSIVKAKSS